MDSSPLLKKPKLEHEQIINGDNSGDASRAVKPNGCDASGGGGNDDDTLPDQEEALVVLSEHQTKECNIIRKKVAHYKTQLEEAEKRLGETQAKLARIRHRSKASPPPAVAVKVEDKQSSPSCSNQERSQIRSTTVQQSSRPQLLIPPHNAKPPMPADARGGREPKPELKANSGAGIEKAKSFPDKGAPAEAQEKRIKRKLEQKEHRDLIPKIRTSSSPCIIKFQSGILISSHHKRKLRSLELCPVNDHLFVTRFFFMIQKGANFAYSKADSNCFSDVAFPIVVPDLVRQIMAKALLGVCIDHQTILILISTADFFTSALDGVVNLWQVQGKGSNASLLSSVDCLSPKQRRWPEDIAWHPDGDSIFAAYTADGGDSQISILNLNASREKKVSFLDRKPHHKGIINSIMFMPWRDICFTTGGSDHTVILWQEADDSWKSKTIHGNLHSSAVMGVAGLYQKKTILSVGADKRIIAFDLSAGRSEFKNQIESKCMSVLPNPSDFNLYMVQTGEPGKQLRLFDVRLRQTEIHAFGWKQETSESQSALINQAWSPDGLYASSGSADPVIHIFDIRCDGRKPSQSVQAHQKRVFKAVWHQSLPLLTSISSDLNIGLHRTL